ncbi:MAG: thioredoxin domain-containing protein, partial [Planctomycetota bacterium]|nr:thioredoxin domain-containing protein [Planctomycetota bacterium]
DGALPSGSGVAVETLLRLGQHLDAADLTDPALRTLTAYRPLAEQAQSAFASLLVGAELAAESAVQVAVVAERRDADSDALLAEVRNRYLSNRVISFATAADDTRGLPMLQGKGSLDGTATAYVCRDYVCDAPTTDPEVLGRALDARRNP